MPNDEPIVLYTPRMRLATGVLVLSAMAVLFGYVMLDLPSFGALYLACLAGVVLSGLGALTMIGRLRDRRPALVIGNDGLTDESSFGSVGFIGWDEIAEVRIFRRNLVKYLGIVPKDPAALGRRAGWRARLTLGFNRLIFVPPIVINGKAVGANIDLLAQLIGERHAAAQAERKGGGWKKLSDG